MEGLNIFSPASTKRSSSSSVQASWRDVPNEYGLRRLDRASTLRLIGKSVLFWSIVGNGIYTSTVCCRKNISSSIIRFFDIFLQTLVENFFRISSPMSLSFWGTFVFVSGYASVKGMYKFLVCKFSLQVACHSPDVICSAIFFHRSQTRQFGGLDCIGCMYV